MNESLFEDKKINSYLARNLKDFMKLLKNLKKDIANKKFIFNSDLLEKRSKLRQLFEKEKI